MRRLLTRALGGLIAAALAVCGTGLFHAHSPFDQWHRWSGHALLIGVWFIAPISLLVIAFEFRRRGLFHSLSHAAVIVAGVFFLLITLISGSLRPEEDIPGIEETKNRFIVLHMIVLPILTMACFVGWFAMTLPRAGDSTE